MSHHEEFTTMEQVSSKLNSISQSLAARDRVDADRRKVDDTRDTRLLERVDAHGIRTTAIETKWEAFFGPNGAFTYVTRKIEATDKQNRWIITFVIATLVGVIANLVTKH
jgi:hypothetical protein